VARGGGTGFAGGAVPIDGGVVCSLERLNSIRRFEPSFWRMEAEAGVITATVHKVARDSGLLFPPDPGASEQSQIGGNIACNAGGPHSFKYGVTGAWVTGIEVVTAYGRVARFGGPFRKDVAGYDLRALFIGSEGTLGIVTSAWLKLIPAPEVVIPIVAGYPSLEAGMNAFRRVYEYGLVPAALEYFDQGCLEIIGANFPGGLPPETHFMLLAEADGTRSQAEELGASLNEALSGEALTVRALDSPSEAKALWRWRNGVSFAVSSRRGGKMSEDIVVPVDALEAAISMVYEVGELFGLQACSWGHAGDANLHATFLIDASSRHEVNAAKAGAEELFARTLAMHGTVSGEHGLGWVKRSQFERQFSHEEVRLQMMLKSVFDPKNLFNPGKKVSSNGLAG
jgi:FAD/FMN-containing dehydrogenase